jgi:hypothetical protein
VKHINVKAGNLEQREKDMQSHLKRNVFVKRSVSFLLIGRFQVKCGHQNGKIDRFLCGGLFSLLLASLAFQADLSPAYEALVM